MKFVILIPYNPHMGQTVTLIPYARHMTMFTGLVIGPYMQEDDWVADSLIFKHPGLAQLDQWHDHDSMQNTEMFPVHEYIDKKH